VHATFAKPATAEQIWTDLVAGNQRFRAGEPQPRDLVAEREAVAAGQHPKAIVLACSDSRVAPEIIFDQGLGDLFVIRAAGNTADALAIGSIEFAAERLDVPVLVVLGHQSCGAVRAACTPAKAMSANLSAVLNPIRPACHQPGLDGDALLRAVELDNARRSARDILDGSPLLCHLVEQGRLAIIEAYYRLDTGEVQRLGPSGDLVIG
jgi:carbonic anhydrase